MGISVHGENLNGACSQTYYSVTIVQNLEKRIPFQKLNYSIPISNNHVKYKRSMPSFNFCYTIQYSITFRNSE